MKKMRINLFTLLYMLAMPILFIDVYKSDTKVLTYFHVDSRTIELGIIVSLILLRIFLQQRLNPLIAKLNARIVLPVTLFLSVSLAVWDYLSPPNYVYSITLLQPAQIFYISILSAIVWLLDHSGTWFTKHFQKILFYGSLAHLAAAYVTSLFPRDVFAELSKEDHLVEYLQCVVLIFGAFFAAQAARLLYKKNSKINAALFLLASVALILITGDEISWGQRLLHLTTPESLAAVNHQREITIHNTHIFASYVSLAYITIGFYGATAWIIQSIFSKLKKVPFSYYIPPWYCSIFFVTGFAYNFYAQPHIIHTIGVWSESAELMLYAGVMFTMLSVVFAMRKYRQ